MNSQRYLLRTLTTYLNYFANRGGDRKDSRKNFIERNRRSYSQRTFSSDYDRLILISCFQHMQARSIKLIKLGTRQSFSVKCCKNGQIARTWL